MHGFLVLFQTKLLKVRMYFKREQWWDSVSDMAWRTASPIVARRFVAIVKATLPYVNLVFSSFT
jgi:hypothetical protein